MPLHVEILYNEYDFAAAFAVASLLALLALVTLVVKTLLESRAQPARESSRQAATLEETCRMSIEVSNIRKRFGTFAALDESA